MILCCGEALIDMLPRQTSTDESAFAPHAGGAVFNTARALGRLGAPAGFFSGISTDLFGKILDEGLAQSNVDTSLCARSARPTTLAFVTLVDGQAKYAFYDEGTAGRMLSHADLPPSLDGVDTLFFGGISLVSEPCAETYEALLTQTAADHVTMIDPNIRPSFITDEPRYRARIERMLGLVDIVKLSDEDLAWLTGEEDMAQNAKLLLAKGPKLLFITEGAKGAWAYTANTATFVASQKVDVIDTVGAGDTFNAGVLAALQQDGNLEKSKLADLDEAALRAALDLAARSAAITVSRAGANPPWRHELSKDQA